MSVRYLSHLLVLLLLMASMPIGAAGLDDADERLFRAQLAMAQKGNTRAQYYLGEMHENGLGTKQDIDEAFKWYHKAADKGDSMAKRKLALRKEIINEIKKEQEAEKLKSLRPEPKPAKPDNTAKKTAPAAAPVAVAQTKQSQTDQADIEQERIKAAAKEKRRAAVRALILDRIRNPVGELFE